MFPLHKTVLDCLTAVINPKPELIPHTNIIRIPRCEIVFDNLPTELFANSTMLRKLTQAVFSETRRIKKYESIADNILTVDSPDVPCECFTLLPGDIPYHRLRTMIRLDSTVRFTLRLMVPPRYAAKFYEIALDVVNKAYLEYRQYLYDYEQMSVLF